MLHLEISEIVWALVNFAVLVLVLRKFLYKPVMKTLDERRAGIDQALEAAEDARKEVAGTEERLRAEIAASRAEAEAILDAARKRGEETREEIVAAARAEAEQVIVTAKAEIEAEKNRAIAELKGQIADIALLATEKLLNDGITAEQQSRLMDKYIKEVGRLQ